MKKTVKIALPAFVVLLLFLTIGYWPRISGAFTVYHLLREATALLQSGSTRLNVNLRGVWNRGGEQDSLSARVQYKKGDYFFTNVKVKNNQYVIQSKEDQTLVQVSKPHMAIIGKGSDRNEFDLLRMGGEILRNHPQLAPILTYGWWKHAAFSLWSLFHCDFSTEEWSSSSYRIIELPEDVFHTRVTIWSDRKDEGFLRIVAGDGMQSYTFDIFPGDTLIEWRAPEGKILSVDRGELNRAIYRGAIRAAGITLENLMPPEVASKERRWGKGLLRIVNGNRVLIAGGTHREIGQAHGALLKKEVRKMVDATLYTICWVYTLEKGEWFIDAMRRAYHRLEPFIPQKYQEELQGLAETSGISVEELQLTNVFPALFHCSGFALFGEATEDGTLYHGRILDYMTELGLQYHAVVYILKPEGSYGFANVGYAGFIGSVSGLNENQVAFGEMGGGGEGDWDGMPMAFLMREGLERAATLQEAVTIFRDTPRTCEYFYCISDGKIPDARGLSTTPTRFEVIKPHQYHPLLPSPIRDAVLMSGPGRYEKLVERVKQEYGKIDAQKAIRLMDRPVAMKSNLHSVLFAPQTLEFWVANAGPHTPACQEPYTHYSLKELLKQVTEIVSDSSNSSEFNTE